MKQNKPYKTSCNLKQREYILKSNLSCVEDLLFYIQPLTNLKKIDLSGSLSLKEVPDLSDATHLKRLNLTGCWSLVQIPSSIGDLHKLEELEINLRISLQAVPSHLNLAFDQHQIASNRRHNVARVS